MQSWTKVGILLAGFIYAQEEGSPLRLIVYDELFDRFFQIRSWTTTSLTTRPDTVLYLRASGNLPPLERFTHLQALHLSEIEEIDLQALTRQIRRYCPKLKALALEDCEITDLSPLAELSLQGILLDGNPLTDLSPLLRLADLQFLSLARTPIQDISPLAQISSLQALDLSETAIRDLTPLRSLSRLRMLALFRCTAIEDFSPLLVHSQLELLNISHTRPEAARKMLIQIGLFPRLRVLQAQGIIQESASLAALGTLTEMEELTLGQNAAIRDLSFVRLLRKLLYLDIHHCSVPDLSPLAGLPYLVKLSVGKNRVTSLAPLIQCPRLAYLYCYENPIQDWEKLLEMPALTYVMLSRKDLPPERLQALVSRLRKKGVMVDAP